MANPRSQPDAAVRGRPRVRRPAPSGRRWWALAVASAVLAAGAAALLLTRGDRGAGAGFSGAVAMRHVEALVGFGPRPAGSAALESSRGYIEKHLAEAGWEVRRQTFSKTTRLRGKVEFVNLRARVKGSPAAADWTRGDGMVLLASHYDTKWYEEFEFVGANDSASSTGLLIALAEFLRREHPAVAARLELVFFDGEEAFGENITDTDGLYGSRYYARRLWRPAQPARRPSHGILLDMVGDRDLVLTPPTNSPRELADLAVRVAGELGLGDHIEHGTSAIIDDHVPLNLDARIPTVDLIDFSYRGIWHTRYDTLDRLSARSLEITGRITIGMLLELLPPD